MLLVLGEVYMNRTALLSVLGALCSIGTAFSSDYSWKNRIQEKELKLGQAHTDDIILKPLLKEGSEERIDRHGVLVWFENAEATIVMCHGFLCNKYSTLG